MAIIEIEIVARLVLAAVLGMLIGFERELHHKPAGMRTHVMVCIGATLFTIVSTSIKGDLVDASRIASGVVIGIGFLGAGTIFKSASKVIGLTTAAELWVLAAIGLAIGIGLYTTAIVTTIIVLLILFPGKMMEAKLKKR
jgi:putative Mg2+ transporter-C (MgtC) family protein